MEIENKELSEYIKAFLEGIEKGLIEGYFISPSHPIEFELAVMNKQEAGGRLRILVADAKGKISGEHISKVKFKITKSSPMAFGVG